MSRVIVYIATSADGFIAGPDDDLSWLEPFTIPGEDYGYAAFMKTIGTVVMGARTYEQSLIHPERLLAGVKNYVLTARSLPPAPGIDREFWPGALPDLVRRIRGESERDIYIVGGGQVISRFLDEGLIDELCLFIVPVLLGRGIPLFTGLRKRYPLVLAGTTPYRSGIVNLRYFPHPPGKGPTG
jgi:dihydrofolate reductase